MSTSVPPALTAAATPTPHSSSPSTCWWPSSPSSATDASFASSASRPPSTRRPTRLWLPWRRQTRPWGPTSRSTSRSTLTCRTSAAWRRVWRGKTLGSYQYVFANDDVNRGNDSVIQSIHGRRQQIIYIQRK